MSDQTWNEWPECATCRRRRQTVCPICGVAGTGFLLAEYLAPAQPIQNSRRGVASDRTETGPAGMEILLMCPQCDEAFAPRFYRHCPECGGDAGEGIEIRTLALEPLSGQLLLAISAILFLGLLLITYFWWLFQT